MAHGLDDPRDGLRVAVQRGAEASAAGATFDVCAIPSTPYIP